MIFKTGSPRAADKIVETIPLSKGESYKETKSLLTQVYIVLIDREIIDNTYKGLALYSLAFIWIMMVIIGFYNRIKYGSKDWEYIEETKRGIFGLIGLLVMAIFMYLFI